MGKSLPASRAVHISIRGIVQGVGFRPFVYRLAHEHDLVGWVLNSTNGVEILAQGRASDVKAFVERLPQQAPPASRIDTLEVAEAPWTPERDAFVIRQSDATLDGRVGVITSPDLALCDECRSELLDPSDRRCGYPFINCTNCGPRYTIIQGLPYDRPKTTMRKFELCDECRREYEDPLDRRFHAQPNACPVCGPELELTVLPSGPSTQGNRAALKEAVRLLKNGHVVAVKGLGGFHLACDATNNQAVRALRQRKGRASKPFAIMARDLETIERFTQVTPVEARWLKRPEAPIVILAGQGGADDRLVLSPDLNPGNVSVGVMLPYTPLHVMLMEEGPRVLVMTSANPSGLPLITDNDEAREQLVGIADAVLAHDRQIHQRCDDSVLRVVDGQEVLFRRSRGFVPRPVVLEATPAVREAVLALGGDMKNVFCLLDRNRAFLSQHIGDMDYEETHDAFYEALSHLVNLMEVDVGAIAYDPHPSYRVNRWLERDVAILSGVGTRIPVQHHHAHMASCMAENGLKDRAVGVVLDGTGYGTDGRLWGFEFLEGDLLSFDRRTRAPYVALPGGEAAIRHPRRLTTAYLVTLLGTDGLARYKRLLAKQAPEEALAEVKQAEELLTSGLKWPEASSCGRFFDAVSALLGICTEVKYEGQAAIELSELADTWSRPTEAFALPLDRTELAVDQTGVRVLALAPLLDRVLQAIEDGVPTAAIACRFQNSLAELVADEARRVAREAELDHVVLSGGSFQNHVLLSRVRRRLREYGLKVYSQRLAPPGDGGLALGQAVVAAARLEAKSGL